MMKPWIASIVVALLFAWTVTASDPAKAESRAFELREYFVAPGKLEALHARFRDGAAKLMERHGISGIGYFVSEDDDNVLRVILAYSDTHARKQAWESFVTDPDWQSLRRRTENGGRLVEKIREYPMNPTRDCPTVITNRNLREGWQFEFQFPEGMPGYPTKSEGEEIEIIGSWLINRDRSGNESQVVRLVARRASSTFGPHVALYQPAASNSQPIRPTAGGLVSSNSSFRDVVLVRPTDYSPIR